ncbi:MAG: efflux RND transporter permease subunit [Bacteroidia bacterium]
MKKFREFGLSSWAIENRTAIYLLTVVIVIVGLVSYRSLPKENFPEVVFPIISVATPYPGTAPADIEKLVNKVIEQEINGIKGIKKISSTAFQDYGNVFVEFETGIDIKEAKDEVQEAVNRSKNDLPSDLPNDPQVTDINLSEVPIMSVNLSGPFDDVTLKKYAEDLQDELEDKVDEILRVDIIGALQQELQVDLDLYKMQNAWVTFGDIEQTIASENVIISGGEIDRERSKVGLRINSELKSEQQISDLQIRSGKGHTVYLRDIAKVSDGFKEQESYARLDRQPVITLNIVKKAGKNLVEAAEKIGVIVERVKSEDLPESLTVTVAQDQSLQTLNTLNELTNTIIIGFILVTLVLMFFMGVRDALFVGLAVPLSSLIAFIVVPSFGFTLNLVVLFTFILAMGIVVDNAIVVIENTYRLYMEEGFPIITAAKKAAGEVIIPVLSGTLTTVAPFLPLLVWPDTTGEFMKFLPITMIITLFASLFVAYVISPVFAVSFMRKDDKPNYRTLLYYSIGMAVLAISLHAGGNALFGNLMIFVIAFVWLNAVALRPVIKYFQNKLIPSMKNGYRKVLRFSMNRPGLAMVLSLLFIFFVAALSAVRSPQVIFFPESDPNFVYVYNEMPLGTRVEVTDSVTHILEDRVYKVLEPHQDIVRSVIANVAINAGDPQSFGQNSADPHKSRLSIEFESVKDRNGKSTQEILEEIRSVTKGIIGAKITVGKENNGPPVGADIEITVTSEDLDKLMFLNSDLLAFLESKAVAGVEKLKSDAEAERQEMIVNIDRAKAAELGLTTGQIGSTIRTAVFGKEVSKFRPPKSEDEYDIVIRLDDSYRNDPGALMNMNITFLDQATGGFRSIPVSAVANLSYSSAIGGINRKDLKKSVTFSTSVPFPYNAAEVSKELMYWVDQYKKEKKLSSDVTISLGGQVVAQEEQGAFLGGAFGAAILFIFLILVTQFNSLINVLIILSQILLSTLGGFVGVVLMGMDFSIIMNGVGIIALSGIVVNNGIILLDFIQQLQKEGKPLKEAVIEGSAVRFTPVLLTASSTVLGLVPLAVSLNVNFETLFTSFDPQIFFGGDSAAFWGPLSWTIIWGLSFATIVTLVFVPTFYYVLHSGNKAAIKFFRRGKESEIEQAEAFEKKRLAAISGMDE